MEQIAIDFSAPIQTRGSLRTRHASAEGAQSATERVARQMVTILDAYRQYGPLTDIEMEARTAIQKSSVIPRRRALMQRGLVIEIGHRKNPATHISNTVFGLPDQVSL